MSGSFLIHNFVAAPRDRSVGRLASIGQTRRRPPQPTAASVWARLETMWRRHRSRVALANLDGHLLRDIGVTYAEAEQEANKPFWKG